MRRLPVDTTTLSFVCAGSPEAALEFDSGAPRTDANGQALYEVRLLAINEGESDVITVKVPGEPKALVTTAPVKVRGLVATPWRMDDGRSGVSYRAAAIEPARSERAAS